MQLNILSPKKTFWQGEAQRVILPARDGELCILNFHQSFLARLKQGFIRFPGHKIFINDGLASLRGNVLNVFIE